MKIPALAGLATTVALVATTLVAGSATAVPGDNPNAGPKLQNASLASVLATDGNAFDTDWADFDVVDRAVHKVIKEKPGSAVAVLANGDKPLTAFIPTDRAFRKLAKSLTGERPATERDAWKAVRAATNWNIDTLEAILLYHVDAPVDLTSTELGTWTSMDGSVTAKTGLLAEDLAYLINGVDGTATLHMASGGVVYATQPTAGGSIYLTDADPDATNPHVIAADLTGTNNIQVAHAINLVLRPLNLPKA